MILALTAWSAAALVSCADGALSSAASVSLENTHWLLVRLGEKPISVTAARQTPSLTLVPKGKSAHGSTGCNRFQGGYRLEGSTLRFTGIAATRMYCMDARELEEQYIRVLDATARWKIVDAQLEFYDAAGTRIAVLAAGR
jgi:heat shock protein HslJ